MDLLKSKWSILCSNTQSGLQKSKRKKVLINKTYKSSKQENVQKKIAQIFQQTFNQHKNFLSFFAVIHLHIR